MKLNAQLSTIRRIGNPTDSVVTSAKMQLAPPEVARSVVKPLFTWGDAKCRANPQAVAVPRLLQLADASMQSLRGVFMWQRAAESYET